VKHINKWLLAGLVALAACAPSKPPETAPPKPPETELSFETIERSDLGSYEIREPQVVLITSQQETSHLDGLVRQDALDQLAQLDFDEYFAIALFRGRQASSGYDTIIERVARRDAQIVIYAQFWSPSPHWGVQAVQTSPYHLIKVRKDNGVSQETETMLQISAVTPTPPF